jgi:hypothetical protein
MALKFDWSHYISVQMEWADALKTHATDVHGYDPEFLTEKHHAILADLNGRFRRELSDLSLLRRLDRRHQTRRRPRRLNSSTDIPDREAI